MPGDTRQGLKVQAVMFQRDRFTPKVARYWLKRNGYSEGSLDESDPKYWKFVQAPASSFKGKKLKHVAIIGGIDAIVVVSREKTAGAKKPRKKATKKKVTKKKVTKKKVTKKKVTKKKVTKKKVTKKKATKAASKKQRKKTSTK
jgi:hypothetical protein